MGLDMYLYARGYASEYYDPSNLHPILKSTFESIPGENNFLIRKQVAYWRKANQIHSWFVKNVQEGEDDCGNYLVEIKKLKELRDLCQKVIDGSVTKDGPVHTSTVYTWEKGREEIFEPGKIITNPEFAKSILPNQSGFFFGSTDYDDGYLEQLQDTIDQLDPLIRWAESDVGKHWDFEYRSSW